MNKNLKVGLITLISQFLINNKKKSIDSNNKKLNNNDVFNNNNKILIIPITAYIIRGMDMNVQKTLISNTITPKIVRDIFEDVNNFFTSSNIYWNLIGIEEYRLQDTTNLSKIAEMTRDNTPDEIRLGYYKSLISKNSCGEHYVNKKTSNIYFSTFNGNSRQGNANINDDDIFGPNIIMTMVGTWTNKPYGTEKNATPISRLEWDEANIQSKVAPLHQENKPSLSFTVAHELAHTLGLIHIKNNNNLMNSKSSSSNLTYKQKKTMKTMAKNLMKKYNSKMREISC